MKRVVGEGRATAPAAPEIVWAALLDPAVLRAIIPGAQTIEREAEGRFRAVLSFGVGRLRGNYDTQLDLIDLVPPRSLTMAGTSVGWFGSGRAHGRVVLTGRGSTTLVHYSYEGEVSGAVSLSGAAVLGGVSRIFVARVFAALARWPYRTSIGPSA